MANMVSQFKEKTKLYFHEIHGKNAEQIEECVKEYILDIIELDELDIEIVGLALTGSRCRGKERKDSDIDVVVEYRGNMKEYVLFNYLKLPGIFLYDIWVDINPIRAEESGTLEEYLCEAEKYLAGKE